MSTSQALWELNRENLALLRLGKHLRRGDGHFARKGIARALRRNRKLCRTLAKLDNLRAA